MAFLDIKNQVSPCSWATLCPPGRAGGTLPASSGRWKNERPRSDAGSFFHRAACLQRAPTGGEGPAVELFQCEGELEGS